MRKFVLLAAGSMAVTAILLSTGATAGSKSELPQDAVEQVILRLLHQPVKEAVNDYYDGPRQYWEQEVLSNRGKSSRKLHPPCLKLADCSTFVIGENGIIEKVMPKVKPDTNAAEILAYLKGDK